MVFWFFFMDSIKRNSLICILFWKMKVCNNACCWSFCIPVKLMNIFLKVKFFIENWCTYLLKRSFNFLFFFCLSVITNFSYMCCNFSLKFKKLWKIHWKLNYLSWTSVDTCMLEKNFYKNVFSNNEIST